MFTNTNLQPKRIHKYICDMSIHTVEVYLVHVGLRMGVLNMHMRIWLCKHAKAYLYYAKEKKRNI